jgi:hypothetical protein
MTRMEVYIDKIIYYIVYKTVLLSKKSRKCPRAYARGPPRKF